MKKILLVILLVLLAVGISGCVSNTDNSAANNSTTGAGNSTDNSAADNSTVDGSTEPPEGNDSNNSGDAGNNSTNITLPPFEPSIVAADPVPSDFEYTGAIAVKSNSVSIGISGVLSGYRGMYTYEGNNMFLAVFRCNETTLTAETYLQQMKTAHADQYDKNSEIQTIQINGKDVTLLATNVQELPTTGRYMLAWTQTDSWDDADYLIIVYGQADLDALKTLVEAAKL